MGTGDVLAQFVVEKKSFEQFQWQRTFRFFSLGTFFVGPTLGTWYGALHKYIGSGKGIVAVKKVAVDQLLFAPGFIVVFLVTLGILEGSSFEASQDMVRKKYKDILLVNWSVWPAVQICNFSFTPLHHQVLVVQIFALLWNTYLAWKTNLPTTPPEKIADS
ncbi:protein Mpv17 isoform X2 [Palaemon carinicauda]